MSPETLPNDTMAFADVLREMDIDFIVLGEYGITENRYFVLAMAIGLSITVLYFIFSRRKDIRVIPGILCVLAFLSALGPWSAFSISISDQQGRLESIMTRYEILADGAIQKAPGKIPLEDRQQMSSIVSYLTDWHGLESFSGWLDDSSLASLDTVSGWYQDNEITRLMGFEWVRGQVDFVMGGRFSVKRRSNETFDIAGFEQQVGIHVGDEKEIFWVDGISGAVKFNIDQRLLTIRLGESESSDSLVEISLSEALAEFVENNNATVETVRMTFSGECTAFDARVVCDQISGWQKEDSLTGSYIEAVLLLRLK